MNVGKFLMLLPTVLAILMFVSCLFGTCVYGLKKGQKQGVSDERIRELLKKRDLQEQEWRLYK